MWRAFLKNHAKDLIAVDFFTVPTATFRVLFVFVVLSHRRRVISATMAWKKSRKLRSAGPRLDP